MPIARTAAVRGGVAGCAARGACSLCVEVVFVVVLVVPVALVVVVELVVELVLVVREPLVVVELVEVVELVVELVLELILVELVLGPRGVLDDPDVTAAWAADWTGRYRCDQPLVLRPSGVDDVRAVVDAARKLEMEMPIAGLVMALVSGAVTTDQAVEALLSRPLKEE